MCASAIAYLNRVKVFWFFVYIFSVFGFYFKHRSLAPQHQWSIPMHRSCRTPVEGDRAVWQVSRRLSARSIRANRGGEQAPTRRTTHEDHVRLCQIPCTSSACKSWKSW